MKYKAELQDLYLSLKDENKSITAIANIVFNDDNNIDLTLDTLKVYLRTIKRELNVVTTIENEEDWSVVRDKYIFSHKGDKKVFSIDMIDKIFLPLLFIHYGPFIGVDGSLFGNNSGCFEMNDSFLF